jgi:uncharacterized cupin superfamily protein
VTGTKPNAPIACADVAWEANQSDGSLISRRRALTNAAGGAPASVGFVLEELSPGMTTSLAHWHTREEEHVFILSGALTARIGPARHLMRAGDYVRFPAGVAEEHTLFNHTDAVCRYILVGTRDADDICYYPEAGQMKVAATGRIYPLDAGRDGWE